MCESKAVFGSRKIFSGNAIFGKGKYFQVFGCIMKIVVENIFMCLVLFWKCYFPTKFSHFLSYFLNIQTNFITENFKITAKSQSTEQITAKSQHHTPPKLQFNPRQQTPAIKSHNHQNTTTTPPQQQQKSKSHRNQNHTQREIDGSKALGRRRDRAMWCDRRDAAIDETDAIWCVQSSDWSSGFTGDVKGVIWASSSSSRSLSLSWSENHLKWK